MKRIRYIFRRVKFTYIKYTLLTFLCCMFFVKGYVPFEETGANYFHVLVSGTEVGVVGDVAEIDTLVIQARKEIAAASNDIVFMDFKVETRDEEVLWGKLSNAHDIVTKMKAVMEKRIRETMRRAYTLKVNEYMVNLSSTEDVKAVLQAALDKYDTEHKFQADLVHDNNRQFSIYTSQILTTEEQDEIEAKYAGDYTQAGVQEFLGQLGKEEEEKSDKTFWDYDYGLLSMQFSEDVEVVEAYLPENQITGLEKAINEVTKEQETPSEYEVVAGDTLSEISLKVNIPMDRIVEMNGDKLSSINSPIRIGDKLIITIPEPELSVKRVERVYTEEIYDADVQYIDVKEWYTTQTEVIQQPSAGFRKAVADIYYLNDKVVDKEIIQQEVVMEAVAKIVKRGTKIPPTYVKPLSGGRLSSNFGKRKAPTKGASTYHKGVDWSTPVKTPIYASCGGTVQKAGWGSGYGYVVYINHEDGRQTRYAHLSKILVKAGQTVKQGEKIALSGNTGITSGPHLHFEILIGGKQVDPLKYVSK